MKSVTLLVILFVYKSIETICKRTLRIHEDAIQGFMFCRYNNNQHASMCRCSRWNLRLRGGLITGKKSDYTSTNAKINYPLRNFPYLYFLNHSREQTRDFGWVPDKTIVTKPRVDETMIQVTEVPWYEYSGIAPSILPKSSKILLKNIDVIVLLSSTIFSSWIAMPFFLFKLTVICINKNTQHNILERNLVYFMTREY